MEERVRILYEFGQNELAYVAAKTHGLEEEAAKIAETLGDSVPNMNGAKGALLAPPVPIMKLHESNWPLLTRAKGFFEATMEEGGDAARMAAADDGDETGAGGGDGWSSSEDESGDEKPGLGACALPHCLFKPKSKHTSLTYSS